MANLWSDRGYRIVSNLRPSLKYIVLMQKQTQMTILFARWNNGIICYHWPWGKTIILQNANYRHNRDTDWSRCYCLCVISTLLEKRWCYSSRESTSQGRYKLKVRNLKNNEKWNIDYVIVDDRKLTPLLSRKTFSCSTNLHCPQTSQRLGFEVYVISYLCWMAFFLDSRSST